MTWSFIRKEGVVPRSGFSGEVILMAWNENGEWRIGNAGREKEALDQAACCSLCHDY